MKLKRKGNMIGNVVKINSNNVEVNTENLNVYSETDTVIGVWVNGKKIHRIVRKFTEAIEFNSTWTVKNDLFTGLNFSTIINMCGVNSGEEYTPLFWWKETTDNKVKTYGTATNCDVVVIEYVELA